MDIADLLIANEILRDLQIAEEDVQEERQLLNMTNPFGLADGAFIKRFRVNKELARDIIQIVTPFMQAPQRRSGTAFKVVVILSHNFLAFFFCENICKLPTYKLWLLFHPFCQYMFLGPIHRVGTDF